MLSWPSVAQELAKITVDPARVSIVRRTCTRMSCVIAKNKP